MPRCFLAKKSSILKKNEKWQNRDDDCDEDDINNNCGPEHCHVANRSTVGSIHAAQAVQSLREPVALTPLPPTNFVLKPVATPRVVCDDHQVVVKQELDDGTLQQPEQQQHQLQIHPQQPLQQLQPQFHPQGIASNKGERRKHKDQELVDAS